MSKSSSTAEQPKLRPWQQYLALAPTPEAKKVAQANREAPKLAARAPDVVRKEALSRLPPGQRRSRTAILGATSLEFGQYARQTFRWALENAAGWVVALVAAADAEEEVDSPIGVNKKLLCKYALSFPKVKAEVDYKLRLLLAERQVKETGDLSLKLVRFGEFRAFTWHELSTSTKREHRNTCAFARGLQKVKEGSPIGEFQVYLRGLRTASDAKRSSSREPSAASTSASGGALQSPGAKLLKAISRPTPASSGEPLQDIKSIGAQTRNGDVSNAATKSGGQAVTRTTQPTDVLQKLEDYMSDEALLQLTQEAEKSRGGLGDSQTGSQTLQPLVIRESAATKLHLRKEWLQTLPVEDHVWLSKALYDERGVLFNKLYLWYHPPQPAVLYSQPPASGHHYFQHRFFLWMPYRMWGCQFQCSQPDCDRHQLSSCGVYKTVRRVIDQDDDYYMGTEYLQCGRCKAKTPGWSQVILAQLSLGLRAYFPAVLSYKLALDKRVISDLRDRSLGNSSTRLQRSLQERHYSDYLQRKLKYFTTLDSFGKSLTTQVRPKEVPAFRPVPSAGWVLSVYVSDIFSRLDELKAKVTSTFGTILKMDSTKRVVKKLAGSAAGTAAWSTNVGNEHGQVLMSVLTASEATGLKEMTRGLIKRYESAGVPQPLVLYVDRDCCGKFHIWAKDLFPQWKDLAVRLDIWHFMRRLGSCVSSESHPLYGPFMKKLSGAIFQWDEDEVRALRQAKVQEVLQSRGQTVSPRDVELTSKELARHCRRGTRGAAETESLIDNLLKLYTGDAGLETLGVPLFNVTKLEEAWAQQRAHVTCIQDPPGVSLYQQVGTQSKGNMSLPVYRCARGTTSLESFHLHLNRFIPGESASAANFQAYLLEGMARWNADRHAAAMTTSQHLCYNYQLQHEVERLASKLGAEPGMTATHPARYTGELIGVEYLYSQTGQPLSNLCRPEEEEEGEQPDQEEFVVEDDEDDEDAYNFIASPPPSPQPSSPVPVISSSPPHLLPELEAVNAEEVERQEIFREPSLPVLDREAPSTPPDLDSPPADERSGRIRVMDLAQHLVTFRSVEALSSSQVAETIRLYTRLADVDKARVKFPPRHKATLTKGRFGQQKSTVVEGTESVKRGFLGQSGTAAQWPNVSRLVEDIFTLLLKIHPAGVRVPGGGRTDRLATVLRDYKQIRRLVTDDGELGKETTIQLFDVNRHTLTQWINRTEQAREVKSLEAGIGAPTPPMTVRNLPPPADIPLVTPTAESHTQTIEDTRGQAKQRRQTQAVPDVEASAHPFYLVHSGEGMFRLVPHQPQYRPVPVPVSSTLLPDMESAQKRTQKRQRVKEEERVNKRTKTFNTCKTCGQPKLKETGHKGYKGYSHCPASSETYPEFLNRVTILIAEKKSKKSQP